MFVRNDELLLRMFCRVVCTHTQEFRGGTSQRGLTQITKIKDKTIPLQAWTGPEGSRRLRLPDFKTIGT